ncbi:MAG: hypothetical protein F6J93_33520 [Oscillatoria sp. SIO1A7]|nr:hypothetical protein [Oscillatoria sp. SIO1A7]
MGLAVDFEIDDGSGQLQVYFQYDARRFSPTDADGFVRSYVEAIDDLLARPYRVPQHRAIAGNPDRISSLVAEAFGNALGDSVEAGSGFLSAGGNSLSAVKVVSELRQATGRMIPLSAMAGDPTIEEVAAAITIAPQQVSQATGHSRPKSDRFASPDENPWLVRNCIVKEPRLRLFAFPPAGANAGIFDDWPGLLPPTIAKSIEIVPIQYPGRQERLKEPAIANMKELVGSVASAISPLCDRPFALLGSSLGALIAFETARLLRADLGVEPSHLFVVCARAPQRKEPYPRFHAMTDAELIETLDSFEGVAPEILANSELLNLLLPIIRADSLVSSSYRYLL